MAGKNTQTENIQTALSAIADIAAYNPYMRSYLSFRACGFSFRESCQLAGVGESTVRRWKASYSDFAELDEKGNIRELVDKFSYRYLEFEFLRNYRLVLKKDYDVILKSVLTPESMAKGEENYLMRARSHYTPEQLAVIKKLIEAGGMEELSFTQLVLQFGQEQMKLMAGEVRRSA